MSLHVFMMRHARTAWNESRRIQGQTDIPASAAGLAEARDWRLPPTLQPTAFWCSDLSRAQTTAAVLQDTSAAPLYADARLREMNWGDWAGDTLTALRQRLGQTFDKQEARGLDLQPSAGETPRAVRARLHDWLCEQPATGRIAVVTHKGVLRAALSLATGWNYHGKPPAKAAHGMGYWFTWNAAERRLAVLALDVPLTLDIG